jgi:hypothetical protein
MGEVLEGEVVTTGPSRASTTTKLSAPYTGKKLQNQILREMDERMARADYAFTLSTVARRHGIPAAHFISLLHDAFESPNHDLHEFASEVHKRWAACEEYLYGKMLATGEAKGRWESFATGLERTRPDDWKKPSQAAALSQGGVNIGVAEKVALIIGSAGELTTGD